MNGLSPRPTVVAAVAKRATQSLKGNPVLKTARSLKRGQVGKEGSPVKMAAKGDRTALGH